MSEISLGQVAYEFYMQNLTGAFTCWRYLPEEIKESWEVAASAVEEMVLAK